ncbi:hypothetical protein SAMN02745245_00975 [Anaerosphaera aminiphila DSM 21120]|uniref:DUF6487 domain-containing protein n=1 Tax=Anaerosphaera aminiphila DSM 21120 TaxID=1120995 RepID=A0A1M5RNB8_9FIRM|nr:PF20097 family protein [Anaerosphaera aminiphila]SHH27774.1 hypothetical protein SAMN02745245_00975 [Anaerosphaera aminiphila DSM 21120]
MKCPICDSEMEKGGIFADTIYVYWYNEEEVKEDTITLKVRTSGVPIGKNNFVLGTTRIENAYLCKKCKKIVGVFDIARY